jgi:glycosyltransferase involved in cell wall biosynthesis
MPVKNAEAFLSDCLESILDQREKSWELIAVNDHSTDASWEILKEYSKKDHRIKCFNNQGTGIILALRKAYRNSKGEMIHRMDADDLMPPNKLSDLKSLLIQSGRGSIASGKVKYFSDGNLKDGYRKYEKWLNLLVEENRHWQEIYKECVIASPNWLVFREDLEKAGAFEHNTYPEDYDLIFRFYISGLKVQSAHVITHLWRDHAKRSSRTLEVYKDNAYFDLKWHYFEKMERQVYRPLMIWGAGPKGKKLAKTLNRKEVQYQWVSNNPNKHGKEIYQQILASYTQILREENPQIIVAVGQRKAQSEIISFLQAHDYKHGSDYYFFC